MFIFREQDWMTTCGKQLPHSRPHLLSSALLDWPSARWWHQIPAFSAEGGTLSQGSGSHRAGREPIQPTPSFFLSWSVGPSCSYLRLGVRFLESLTVSSRRGPGVQVVRWSLRPGSPLAWLGRSRGQWGLERTSGCGACARRVMALEMCGAVGGGALRTAETGGCYEAAL